MTILKSSVAKKVAMALSGLFLVSFILIHLAINLTLIYPGLLMQLLNLWEPIRLFN